MKILPTLLLLIVAIVCWASCDGYSGDQCGDRCNPGSNEHGVVEDWGEDNCGNLDRVWQPSASSVGRDCCERSTNFVDACSEDCTDEVEEICSAECGLQCVAQAFSSRACCAPVYQPRDQATIVSNIYIHLASVNATVVSPQSEMKYLTSAKLVTFYKDKLGYVLVVKLPQIECNAPGSLFAFHQECMPPEVLLGSVKCLYRDPVLTLRLFVEPGEMITRSTLTNSLISAYFPHDNSDIDIDPAIANCDVPVVKAAMQRFASSKGEVIREIWLTNARYVAAAIVWNVICDFGPFNFVKYDPSTLMSIYAHSAADNEIVRPCGDGGDLTQCAVTLVQEHGVCLPLAQSDRPVCRDNVYLYIADCNATICRGQFLLHNLTAAVECLTWNKGTGVLTMCLRFIGPSFYAPVTTITAFPAGAAPVTTQGYTAAKYPALVTANIPVGSGPTMELNWKTLANAFFSVTFPDGSWIEVDPKFNTCQNPAIQKSMQCLTDHEELAAKQIFGTEGPSYFYMWLQTACDFGLQVWNGHYQKNAEYC